MPIFRRRTNTMIQEIKVLRDVIKASMLGGHQKKGMVGGLISAAVGIVALVIAVVVGISILATTRTVSTVSSNGNATLAIDNGITGLGLFTSFTSIIVMAAIGLVILGLVFLYNKQK